MRVNCIQVTSYRGGGGEVNGHALWEKIEIFTTELKTRI